MFQIKICGLTTPEDALAAIEAGADALGLNFHPASPRYVTPSQAAQIVQKVRHAGWGGTVVAVVVQDETTLAADPQLACIDAWQLHGNQSPENLAHLQKMLAHTRASPSPANSSDAGGPRWRIIRALAWRRDEPSFLFDYLQACQRMGALPDALLVDAFHSGLFGGTGRTLDWDALAAQRGVLGGLPLILAGGLTPENVAMAIQRVRPTAVDVASGVESSPGRKDPAKLRAFVAAARNAFQATQDAKRL
jgi:phosphoribosylanthranilate isomerase